METLKCIMKLTLTPRVFASLANFLASDENVIMPPAGFQFSAAAPFQYVRLVKATQSEQLITHTVVLEVCLVIKMRLFGSRESLRDYHVPERYAQSLHKALSIYPPDSIYDKALTKEEYRNLKLKSKLRYIIRRDDGFWDASVEVIQEPKPENGFVAQVRIISIAEGPSDLDPRDTYNALLGTLFHQD